MTKSLKNKYRKLVEAKTKNIGSFREFVHALASDGNSDAKSWLDHKKKSFTLPAKQLRLKNKGPRIALEKNATKMAKRKKKASSSSTTTS
jgi:hypothetical protein